MVIVSLLKRAVILKINYMPNGLTSIIIIIQKKSTKFSGMLGEDEKMIREKFW